jgi:hypothetical protein
MNRLHLTRLAAIAALLALPTAAFAQSDPNWHGGYGGYGNRGGYGDRQGQIGGIVSDFAPFNLYLDRGTHVALHQGTVINPTGITLRRGMRVQVYGYWRRDGSFEANEIDVAGRDRRWDR